jgi:hypothetical protein
MNNNTPIKITITNGNAMKRGDHQCWRRSSWGVLGTPLEATPIASSFSISAAFFVFLLARRGRGFDSELSPVSDFVMMYSHLKTTCN